MPTVKGTIMAIEAASWNEPEKLQRRKKIKLYLRNPWLPNEKIVVIIKYPVVYPPGSRRLIINSKTVLINGKAIFI